MDEVDILRVAHGDSAAFERIVNRYSESLLAWFRKRRQADAEDHVQEVLIRVYTKAKSYRPGSFRAWLYRIAENYLIDQLRYSGRRPAMFDLQSKFEDEPDLEPWAMPASSDPCLVAQQAEFVTTVRNAIEEIPVDQAEAITAFAEGWSIPEIANMFDCPLPTAKSKLRLARNKILARLGEERFLEAVG